VRSILLSTALLIGAVGSGGALLQPAPSLEIAPMGKLRVATIGVRVLSGVAEPVGKFIAERLGVSYEAVVYTNPEAYMQSFGKGEWEIAIGPRVLAAAEKSDLSEDLWLIPLMYVAAPGREFADAAQVDRPGVKVGAPQDAPSERYLSRTLKSAELVRIPVSADIVIDAAVEMLRSGKADVFGADTGIVHSIADGLPGAKIVPGTFNTVRVAVAFAKGQSAAAQAKLAEIVNDAKRSGVVQKAIEQAGLKGVRVAPD
jgi:polar amino acid transport system substrate-binding protein